MVSWGEALKARHSIAQGKALGHAAKMEPALKGQDKTVSPFQGSSLIVPRWGYLLSIQVHLAFACFTGSAIGDWLLVIATISFTAGSILFVSKRGAMPKTSNATSSSAKGTLRQRLASLTAGNPSATGPCKIFRTARSM
jgi:hypothetical protein